MPICKLNDVKQSISDGQRLLGLDIGKKTIGLALSDAGLKIATPVKILYRTKFTPNVAELFSLVDEQNVGGLVLDLIVEIKESHHPATLPQGPPHPPTTFTGHS